MPAAEPSWGSALALNNSLLPSPPPCPAAASPGPGPGLRPALAGGWCGGRGLFLALGRGEAGAQASLPRSPQLCFSLRASRGCPSGISLPLPRCRPLPPAPPPLPKFLHRWVQLNVSFPFSRAFIFLNIFFVPASRDGCSLYFRRPCKCDCRRSKRGKGRKILLAAPRFSLCPCEGSPGGMSLRSRLIKKVNPCIQVAAPTCLLLGRAVCAA